MGDNTTNIISLNPVQRIPRYRLLLEVKEEDITFYVFKLVEMVKLKKIN